MDGFKPISQNPGSYFELIMRLLAVLLFVILRNHSIFAIEPEPSVMDTIYLEEITTFADHKKYQPGAKITSFTSTQMESAQTGGIDQLLTRHTPIYIKSNAGGLSSIHIRGTGASHTAINFGGININSLTLGQSNVSQIPVFLFDRLEVQYGGSSALNGTGAIGGALYLSHFNHWSNGLKAEANITLGSFGEQLYGAKIFMGNGRFESVTRLYGYWKENNFLFKNPYTGNVENRQPVDDIQQGAAIHNKGIMQEFNYLFSPNAYIKNSVWLENNWYQIQPNMQSNLNYKTTDDLLSNHIRVWSEYKNENKALKYNLGVGYVHDFQQFNNNHQQEIITDRLITEASVKQPIGKKMEYKAGAKYKFIVPEVYSYSDSVIKNEQHLDLYVSWYYQPVKKLKTTINLRQMLVTNFNAPFTPALGAEYTIQKTPSRVMIANANITRSYRIPTLNDRYWGSQGNPNLKPEEGFNIETGLKHSYSSGKNHNTINLTAFYMDIDNWIEWRNFGVWQAQNVQRVISKGIELNCHYHFETGKIKSDITLNYTFNRVESVNEQSQRRQLIYAPLHLGNISYTAFIGETSFYIDGKYTGTRSANYLGSKLAPNFITNAGATYQFKVKEQPFKITLSANNIFNVSYENEKYYAMPGINFRIGISTSIQSLTL